MGFIEVLTGQRKVLTCEIIFGEADTGEAEHPDRPKVNAPIGAIPGRASL